MAVLLMGVSYDTARVLSKTDRRGSLTTIRDAAILTVVDDLIIIWRATLIALRGLSYAASERLGSGTLSPEQKEIETEKRRRADEEIRIIEERLKAYGDSGEEDVQE